MYAVDLHVHTRPFHSPKGRPSWYDPFGARTVAAMGHERGLDGVALTNHDYRAPFENVVPLFVPGVEVTTSDGHVLVVGPDPPRRTEANARSAAAVVEEAHDRGCAAIIAHPFRDSAVADVDAPFDAIEINGKHPERKDRVDALARELDLPVVGGSDAHFPFELGRVHTVVHADELTPETLVRAIRDGHVEPASRTYATDRLLLPLYDTVHRIKAYAQRGVRARRT